MLMLNDNEVNREGTICHCTVWTFGKVHTVSILRLRHWIFNRRDSTLNISIFMPIDESDHVTHLTCGCLSRAAVDITVERALTREVLPESTWPRIPTLMFSTPMWMILTECLVALGSIADLSWRSSQWLILHGTVYNSP